MNFWSSAKRFPVVNLTGEYAFGNSIGILRKYNVGYLRGIFTSFIKQLIPRTLGDTLGRRRNFPKG